RDQTELRFNRGEEDILTKSLILRALIRGRHPADGLHWPVRSGIARYREIDIVDSIESRHIDHRSIENCGECTLRKFRQSHAGTRHPLIWQVRTDMPSFLP